MGRQVISPTAPVWCFSRPGRMVRLRLSTLDCTSESSDDTARNNAIAKVAHETPFLAGPACSTMAELCQKGNFSFEINQGDSR